MLNSYTIVAKQNWNMPKIWHSVWNPQASFKMKHPELLASHYALSWGNKYLSYWSKLVAFWRLLPSDSTIVDSTTRIKSFHQTHSCTFLIVNPDFANENAFDKVALTIFSLLEFIFKACSNHTEPRNHKHAWEASLERNFIFLRPYSRSHLYNER